MKINMNFNFYILMIILNFLVRGNRVAENGNIS